MFLISLGPEISGEILRHLKEEEIEQLSLEIASLRKVHPEVRDQIFDEFVDMLAAQEYMTQGAWSTLSPCWNKAWVRKKRA